MKDSAEFIGAPEFRVKTEIKKNFRRFLYFLRLTLYYSFSRDFIAEKCSQLVADSIFESMEETHFSEIWGPAQRQKLK